MIPKLSLVTMKHDLDAKSYHRIGDNINDASTSEGSWEFQAPKDDCIPSTQLRYARSIDPLAVTACVTIYLGFTGLSLLLLFPSAMCLEN